MKKPPIIYYWRKFKLEVIFAYTFYISYSRAQKRRLHFSHCNYNDVLEVISEYKHSKKVLRSKKQIERSINNKCVVIKLKQDKHGSFMLFLSRLIAISWFYEKMGVEVEYITDRSIGTMPCFEGSIDLKQYKQDYFGPLMKKLCPPPLYRSIATHIIDPEVGHKFLSKLRIRSEIKEQVDRYVNPYVEEDWIAVHYRGTDIRANEWRYMTIKSYIVYLKEVLDNQHRIFACSDQAQFIDAMHAAFPARVFATDIQRSYDESPIHISREERPANPHQKRDALIDLLILARAKLIYTTGSGFVDSVRWFNPHTKIISLDGRKRKGNYLAIPRKNIIMSYLKMEKTN